MRRVLSSAEDVSGEPTGWHNPHYSLGNVPPNLWLEVPSLWGIAIQRKTKREKENSRGLPIPCYKTNRIRNNSQGGEGRLTLLLQTQPHPWH